MKVELRRVMNPMGESRRVGGRRRTEEKATPLYEVLLDGQKVGTVGRAPKTREISPRGVRYVTARWESLAWEANDRGDYDTRWRAIREVLWDHLGLTWSTGPESIKKWEAEEAAKEAKVVRS